jgi:flavin reductase (DIM6/NTAB) family NADH-FMN oxidoreductase RutF
MSATAARQALRPDQFVSILGAFPTGVGIVTTVDAQGRPRGLTTNAIMSVSLTPPLLAVGIDRESRTLPMLEAAGVFVVNFMGAGSEALCRTFSSRSEDKFAGVIWEPNRDGAPRLLDDAHGWADCRVERLIEAGDHVLVLGRVDGGGRVDEIRPVIYFGRSFLPL